ncbi:MAG: hypothetical protein LAO24_21760 [Acidobacteriia bacterium]|nr:hypothetical protein [Terriglobia bacterium]
MAPLSYAIAGFDPDVKFGSVIFTTGPNVFAATFDVNTSGVKLRLTSSANAAAMAEPWLRLTAVMMCF